MSFSPERAAERLAGQVDIEELAGLLGERTDELRALVRRQVSSAISSRSTAELLTLTVTEHGRTRTVPPRPTPDYAKQLFRYVKGRGDTGISCRVEAVVEEAVTAAATEFYQSESNLEALSEGLARQLLGRAELHRILEEELRGVGAFVQREIKDAVQVSTGTTVGEQLAHQVGQGAAHALQTSLGGAFAVLLAKALALPAVKVAIVKALSVVLASAAFQKILLIAVKKIGVALLLKLILVKLFGAGAGALVGFVVIPLIVAFLVHEWNTFPEKIAARMSGEVADKLAAESDDLNRQVVTAFVSSALDEVLTRLHDQLISPAS